MDPETHELLIYAVGDVALQRHRPNTAFAKVASILRQADLVFGNLESPITNCRVRANGQEILLHSRVDTMPAIAMAGISVVSVANNHILDCGVEGMKECLQLLDDWSIAHVGVGLNEAEARKPAILERKGMGIAFLAYDSFCTGMGSAEQGKGFWSGTAPIYVGREVDPPHVYIPHLAAMREDIEIAKGRVDLVIVSCHWGLVWDHEVVVLQQVIGRAAIDAGADIVLGHHPHILQGIEVYKGKAICYSLSEFCFEVPFPAVLKPQSILLKIEARAGKIHRVSFLPVLMDTERTPEILSLEDPKGREIADLMGGLCRGLGTKIAIDRDEIVVIGV